MGWSSFTRKNLRYKTIGKLVFVEFDFFGVSNAGSTSFTLPYTAVSDLLVMDTAIRITDNGIAPTTPGLMEMTGGTAIANCYKDYGGNAWTSSGNKGVGGQFFYQAI